MGKISENGQSSGQNWWETKGKEITWFLTNTNTMARKSLVAASSENNEKPLAAKEVLSKDTKPTKYHSSKKIKTKSVLSVSAKKLSPFIANIVF